ncbi:MAG: integral rane sensor signal transduction histidine kinase [Marmoricola sp.]|nr:integral rane sensor signal transduction histidine kinase [Marmoricola sp.]
MSTEDAPHPSVRVRPWDRLTLRGRLVALGTVGVALALAMGSLALYAVLGVAGARALDSSAAATAADVVELVRDGRLPEPIPVTGNQVVQVLDARGRVVSASSNADRLTTLLSPGEVARAVGSPVTVPGSRIGTSGTLRVSAVRVSGRPGRPVPGRTVLVAQAADDVAHAQHVLGATLLATYPLLLLVLALIAWRVVGAALRPVESLRAAADRISGARRRDRLPVPPTHDELRALALTLNSMLDRLAASRERQRSFVADAAHELRSPLASMRTQLEVAERRGEAPEVVPDLVEEVRRMTTLVEDLLVLARLDEPDAAGPVTAAAPVDLGDLLAGVVARHQGGRVPVVLEAPGPAEASLTRPEHLVRAVDNLVTNAVRHAASRVTVRLEAAGAGVTVTVLDDGHGVPAHERERVFERFTRLDEARDRDAGGSGLGLAIARQLVEGLGGTVAVQDAPGGGAAFVLRLPPDQVDRVSRRAGPRTSP